METLGAAPTEPQAEVGKKERKCDYDDEEVEEASDSCDQFDTSNDADFPFEEDATWAIKCLPSRQRWEKSVESADPEVTLRVGTTELVERFFGNFSWNVDHACSMMRTWSQAERIAHVLSYCELLGVDAHQVYKQGKEQLLVLIESPQIDAATMQRILHSPRGGMRLLLEFAAHSRFACVADECQTDRDLGVKICRKHSKKTLADFICESICDNVDSQFAKVMLRDNIFVRAQVQILGFRAESPLVLQWLVSNRLYKPGLRTETLLSCRNSLGFQMLAGEGIIMDFTARNTEATNAAIEPRMVELMLQSGSIISPKVVGLPKPAVLRRLLQLRSQETKTAVTLEQILRLSRSDGMAYASLLIEFDYALDNWSGETNTAIYCALFTLRAVNLQPTPQRRLLPFEVPLVWWRFHTHHLFEPNVKKCVLTALLCMYRSRRRIPRELRKMLLEFAFHQLTTTLPPLVTQPARLSQQQPIPNLELPLEYHGE